MCSVKLEVLVSLSYALHVFQLNLATDTFLNLSLQRVETGR
jgi:hypothetical protein